MSTRAPSPVGVTDRERDVLVLVAGHLTNLEIAERLSLSVRTVESHVSSVIRKLGVSDRRALARRAQELGLLTPRRLHHWPSPASRFVGREPETADLQKRVSEHRWVTVTGPGGVGKTRLTTHAVEEVARDRPDGAWFVDLSQVASPEAVVPAVAAAVGVAEPPGHSLDDTLAETLSRSDAVLVMDNCEHLVPTVAALLDRLLAACPRLSVVATSRAPLRSPHEWVYELPSLSPDDAVRLFRIRAEAAGGVVPDDPRVADLCGQLEGMALAIELAAARYPLLGLDGLAAGLRDPLRLLGSEGGARQRSLRATIGWSVDLLDDEARELFAALSVFAGPFTVASTRTVAQPDHPAADAARVLALLADQHLVYVRPGNPTRYFFQEMVRQYAADLLADQARDVQRRHAEWAAAQLRLLGSAEQDDGWSRRFDELAVEVRAALTRPVAVSTLGEDFAEALLLRGRLEESQHRFEALAATEAGAGDRVRLLRLAAGAAAARLVGDETLRLLDEAAETAAAAGDPDATADALAWTVIFATAYPGMMANPPEQPEITRRLEQVRHLAPARPAAQATVAAANAMRRTAEDGEATAASRRAADRAVAAGDPVTASAALDDVCSRQLVAGEIADALATVRARGVLMDPLPLSAATAYPFNDYLLMGCEVSSAAGDLAGAREYAERLAALPCYRDYVHPALARRLQVDLLSGDLAGAARRGEAFLDSWERAGRHRAATLAVGTYSLAVAHGLLGDDHGVDVWRAVTERLRGGSPRSTDGPGVGWAPTLDAWLSLHRGRADEALELVAVDLVDPQWRASRAPVLMWRPWYAAAQAEAAALAQSPELGAVLTKAAVAAQANPVAAALVRRAEALAEGRLAEVASLAATFEELGALYQRDRSRELAQGAAVSSRSAYQSSGPVRP